MCVHIGEELKSGRVGEWGKRLTEEEGDRTARLPSSPRECACVRCILREDCHVRVVNDHVDAEGHDAREAKSGKERRISAREGRPS
jgi:hypothetical protein